jgi:hypothetical protein
MEVRFITSVAAITPDRGASRGLYVDALGLSLTAEGDGYLHGEDIDGCKSFGIWPLTQAAQACLGTPNWPADRPVPQVSVEFEVEDSDAVQLAADELKDKASRCCTTPRPSRGDRPSLDCSRERERSSASRSPPVCIRSEKGHMSEVDRPRTPDRLRTPLSIGRRSRPKDVRDQLLVLAADRFRLARQHVLESFLPVVGTVLAGDLYAAAQGVTASVVLAPGSVDAGARLDTQRSSDTRPT